MIRPLIMIIGLTVTQGVTTPPPLKRESCPEIDATVKAGEV
jgi:hypothetical protein